MMSADAMDNSGMLFDSDSFDDGFVDNFSISLDNFYAILDEEPRPSQGNFSGTPEGFHPGELAPGHVDLEKAFQPQADISESTTVLEDFRGRGHSQWNLEASDCKREIGFGFLLESEGNSNNFSDNGSLHASQHSDSKNFCSLPSQHSSNWLRLSCANNNNLMDAFGGSSGSFLTSNFDHQHLQNNIPQCSVRPESAKGMDLIYLPDADVNGFYFNKENGKDCEQVEGETSFKSEHKESKLDVNNISSLCRPQNGGIGALPASIVEDGNLYPSLSMYLYMDPDATLPDIVHPVVNACEATNITCDGCNSCLTLPRYSSSDAEIGLDQIFSGHFRSFLSCENEKMDRMEDQLLLSQNSCRTSEVKLGTQEESPDSSLPEVSVTDLDASLRDVLCTEQNHSEDLSLISESSTDSSPIPSSRNTTSDYVDISVVSTSKQLASDPKIILPSKKPKAFLKDERKDQFFASCHNQHDAPKGGSSAVQNNPLRSSLSMEDDSDICILDDISDPACPPRPLVRIKPHPILQRSGLTDPHYSGSGGMRLKADDERLTFRIALQDLSQPKSECSPPDGVLAVPLLRHQRIALSWMVQKETASVHCSGGILADDQGLGKTISTIALILMERSPSSRSCPVIEKHDEFEALNLDDDDDDDDASEVSVMKQPHNSIPMVMSMPMKRENSVMVAKGRPAAGTLVVCPTSVLRQWAEELQTKVTSKANLSFLVYHGSNRTKDPNELAKYDVVLTTYAIVSMEVPKQPLDDKDVEEKGKQDASGVPMGLLSNKKRKDPPISNMNKRKDRSTVDGVLLESAARPLARVGWFRVILDEAQSIKNHRTQVARACWGLRAKRRWCLSGTPIQNAVDDLYSYFRFLRYDPYAVYKSFCSTIKMPISKNPNTGYKKLQAVLKTIMLRRTKGTLIDGKPIITLPPKTVSLKRVEFSMEERAFYSTLEAESREQFKVYAAAGTLKQNYVNILLMLLRLRQACDHPLLVKGCNSNSSWRSSMEMAKKLPRDKQINLLSCLEASLAICTICNDPPEDAVVTICGHVFCNQCICELLTGDENICPSPNCKIQLSVASVFSRGTLKSSLSDELGHDCCSGSSGFEMGDTRKICEDSLSSDSSKIKAALEILQSLPRSQCSSKSNIEKSNGESTGSLVNAVNTVSLRSSVDSSGIQINLNKCSNSKVSEKAIVFSQWTRMLDLLEVPLKASFIQYRRLDGTMSVAAREKAVKDFNTLPEVTVMIMSLKAASLGLNMVAACHVLLLDLWWNPTTEDQAIDRAHRIGQTRPVTVSRLTIKDTVEDRILLLQEKKREMVASAFGEDESGTRQTRLTVEDLKYLFMV